MKSLTEDKTTPVATMSAAADKEDGLITVSGAVPPELAHLFRSVPLSALPEVTRLPPPHQPDPIVGTSRTWMVETDAALPPAQRFLFRVRRRGKLRGVTFVNVQKLLAFLRKAEADYQAEILKAEEVK